MTNPRSLRSVALVLTLVCVCAVAAARPLVETPPTPRRPALHVTTFDGGTFDMAVQRGKWVLVYFWASWCPPCTAAMPAISDFVGTHNDVAAIGLAVLEPNKQGSVQFGSSHPPGFPLAWLDAAATKNIAGNLMGIPVTWLIAPDGTLRQTWSGGYKAAELTQLMRDAGYPDKP